MLSRVGRLCNSGPNRLSAGFFVSRRQRYVNEHLRFIGGPLRHSSDRNRKRKIVGLRGRLRNRDIHTGDGNFSGLLEWQFGLPLFGHAFPAARSIGRHSLGHFFM